MADEAVAFIRDVQLFEHIDRHVSASYGCRLKFVHSVDGVLDALHRQRVPTLLLDSRVEHADPLAEQLIERLAHGALPSLNLVTVGDSFLPRSMAAALTLLSMEHIPVAGEAVQWGAVSERLPQVFAAVRARLLPVRKHVTAGGISFSTFTPELFPTVDDLVRVAPRDVTLLLVGETGTGKTTLAQFVHHCSPRRDRAFQHLACGALPGDLIESELFGHTRGAFTGAERNKVGRFQAAGRGTLLLDEIDVLDLKQQVKLLRVIETGEYELVGSTETHMSEARLIVASNVELEELIERSEFRSDLYYRLNVLEFRLPALRNRPLDIVPLAMQFVEESCSEHNIPIDSVDRQFLRTLRGYHWPGNLRELKNHIRRAVLFAEDRRLTAKDLSPKIRPSLAVAEAATEMRDISGASMADHVARSEREILERTLSQHGHNRTRTAQALGLSRVGLYKKLKRLGLMGTTAEAKTC